MRVLFYTSELNNTNPDRVCGVTLVEVSKVRMRYVWLHGEKQVTSNMANELVDEFLAKGESFAELDFELMNNASGKYFLRVRKPIYNQKELERAKDIYDSIVRSFMKSGYISLHGADSQLEKDDGWTIKCYV